MRYGMNVTIAVALALALTVTACGRRGSLDRPPQAAGTEAPPQTADGKPDRPFILDRLL